jgi:hypothetical protein
VEVKPLVVLSISKTALSFIVFELSRISALFVPKRHGCKTKAKREIEVF